MSPDPAAGPRSVVSLLPGPELREVVGRLRSSSEGDRCCFGCERRQRSLKRSSRCAGAEAVAFDADLSVINSGALDFHGGPRSRREIGRGARFQWIPSPFGGRAWPFFVSVASASFALPRDTLSLFQRYVSFPFASRRGPAGVLNAPVAETGSSRKGPLFSVLYGARPALRGYGLRYCGAARSAARMVAAG